ncbi:XrtA/PEP-CTERM system TPR-repeat protein PrsT [Motiliproteus sediminis]|uniref:XrtA/PEP-CTERM system TPR-repeat protein PrsT n=1 Tax=Motiliproteus sediminis TaxID=1468178 RepID=UPI001AEFBAD3|nr:XrtA/PEP-CTERM system TPR-repeat protein PrsT [Motiliproteus sediminis]
MQAYTFHPTPCVFGLRMNKSSLSVLVLLLVSVLLSGCGAEKSAEDHLRSATERLAQGDKEGYVIEIKNALQKDAQNGGARLMLGRFYLESGEWVAAEKELRKAVDLIGDTLDPHLYLSRSLIQQKKYPELIELVTAFDDSALELPAEMRYYRGVALLFEKRVDESRQQFMRTAASGEGGYHELAAAYLALLDRQADNALAQVQSVLAATPDDFEALLLKSRILTIQSDYEPAVAAIDAASALQPRRLDIALDKAQLQILNADYAAAEKGVDELLRVLPKHPAVNMLKARISLHGGDWESARAHSAAVLAVTEAYTEAKLVNGIASFYLEQWEQAYRNFEGIKNELEEDHPALKMLEFTRVKLGAANSTELILKNISGETEFDQDVISGVGAEYVKQGKFSDAVKVFEQESALFSDDESALVKLGILKLNKLNDGSGVADLQAALESNPSSVWARAALAREYLDQKQTALAITTISELLQLAPDQLDSYLLTADIQLRAGHFDAAASTLQQAEQRFPANVDPVLMQATVHLRAGNDGQAQEALQRSLVLDPLNLQANIALYRLYRQQGAVDKADKLIADAKKANDDASPYIYLQATEELKLGRNRAALELLAQIGSGDRLYPRNKRLAGFVYLAHRQLEKALVEYREWLYRSPDDVEAYLAVAKVLDETGKRNEAQEVLKSGIANRVEVRKLSLALIKLLYGNNQTEEAQRQVGAYTQKYGADAAIERLQGQYLIQLGKPREGIAHIRRSFELSPSQNTLMRLVRLEEKYGEREAVVQLLQDWLEKHPDDHSVRVYLESIVVADKGSADVGFVISQYKELIKERPDNFIALNNLAWTLNDQGKSSEALTYAQRAYELRPNTPEIADTYGQILLAVDRFEEALQVLKPAFEAQSENPVIGYHYAQALLRTNARDEAKRVLQRIGDKPFPQRDAALKLLESL